MYRTDSRPLPFRAGWKTLQDSERKSREFSEFTELFRSRAGPPVSADQCGASLLPLSASPPCFIVAKSTSESTVACKMKGSFYSKPNIRTRDIWKTSNRLGRQGCSNFICFAPGHRKEKLSIFLCAACTQGKHKGRVLASKDPLILLIRIMQLLPWKVFTSSSVINLMKVGKQKRLLSLWLTF